AIRRVLSELLLHFPVYRTYVAGNGRDAIDAAVFAHAMAGARAALRRADQALLDVLAGWLGGTVANDLPAEARRLMNRVVTKFQQLTPPLAAKSVEDTAFYRYGRLLSRNEVGADPGQFSLGRTAFFAACLQRQAAFPHAMLATATHDHKRGEDVRARLMVLAEMPQRWERTVRRWMALNGLPALAAAALPVSQAVPEASPLRPSPADEVMLYQTLVGAWPLGLEATDAEGIRQFITRVGEWLTKAVREAKRDSDWAMPNEAYETLCHDFLFQIFDAGRNAVFIAEVVDLVEQIARPGAINGLSQTLLRLTMPGVPDLYQGTDVWDFSLVDPDNRRPVDFESRRTMLAKNRDAFLPREDNGASGFATDRSSQIAALLSHWQDGAVKQATIAAVLGLRKQRPALFDRAVLLPVKVSGSLERHVVAFLRHDEDAAMLVIALRFPASAGLAVGKDGAQTGLNWARPVSGWGDTALVFEPDWLAALPQAVQQHLQQGMTDQFSGRQLAWANGRLSMDQVLGNLPVAVLTTAH
ncbi:MAG: malto-oligosyltrehalose synthase, partial [Janthinobacterium lividum]